MDDDDKTAALEALRERVRAADGPDRELDASITVALGPPPSSEPWRTYREVRKIERCTVGTYWYVSISGHSLRTSEPITASIDASLALVEKVLPGWYWSLDKMQKKGGGYECGLLGPDFDGVSPCAGFAPWTTSDSLHGTAPLAILDALLTALIEQERQP